MLLLMLSQTLSGATRMLYGRGDLDLILSSPASPRAVVAVRALAVALGALASTAFFVLPLADDAALQGHAGPLMLYPALAGGALLATGVGLALAVALLRTLGPRRTRLAAQLLAAAVGAGFVLGTQLRRLLPPGPLPGSRWAHDLLRLPVRAALGDGGALAIWLALGASVFALAVLTLGPAAAAGARDEIPRAAPRRSATAFPGTPGAALRRKEWRVIARDPWLISQVLLQILYMAPLLALLWSGGGNPALAVAPTIVVVTFQIASSLTWLGLSGEDAPDLLASAPVAAAAVRRAKIEAVGVLTLGIVGLPTLYLFWVSPVAGLMTAALGGVGLMAGVAVQVWHGTPGRRSGFAARHRESKLMGLLEMLLSLLLGVAVALAVLGSAWALAPLAALGAVMAGLRPRRPP